MKISVIIPAYNTEEYLRPLLKELLRQKKEFPDTEIIVVDDGSGYFWLDDLDVKAIHQSNGGEAAARNAGLRNASGDFIAWVDSDDMVVPDYLKILHEAAAKNKDLTVFRWKTQEGVIGYRWSDKLPYYNVWSYLYRRSKIQAEFDERIRYTCDVYWLRENKIWEWDRQEVDKVIVIYNDTRTDSMTAQFNRGEISIWK